MRKLFNYVLLLPLAVVLILISVANRQPVRFSLDPLDTVNPALSLELPLFVFLFAVFLVGMLMGGFLIWLSQGRHRRALREKSHEAEELKRERQSTKATETSNTAEIAPGLPMVSRN